MSSLTQRKKRDKTSTTSSTSSSNAKFQILEEQITKALQTVQMSKHKAEVLHSQWREHLVRMAYLVVLIAMHQCSKPVSECIQELKVVQPFYEETMTAAAAVSSLPASSWSVMGISIILSDCMVELMNLSIAIALFKFLSLRKPHGTFSNMSYCISSSIIIVCLGMFFNDYQRNLTLKEEGEGSITIASNARCVAHLTSWTGDESIVQEYLSFENQIERSQRQFPVSCIFHIIVTGCYFFMKMGLDQCDANIKAMEQVYEDLKESKKKGNNGKGSKKSK